MEFIVSQNSLKEELGFVQGIVEKKNTIPVLSNILIESVGENAIRILGTDLDVTIRCETEAEIVVPGAICVQARKLFDIIRLLPNEKVTFSKEENDWVKVTCGRSSFRLAGVSREQFPEVPSFKSAPLSLPTKVLEYFIQHTSFAITQETSRYTLSGAKFMLEGDIARMVTTDGHRLALVEKKLSEGNSEARMDTLIPKKALSELTKMARGQDSEVKFGEDENHIYFEIDSRLLITRKLSGQFPNYEMVLPKNNDKIAIVDCEEMRNALRRVALMSDERTRGVKIKVSNGEMLLTAQSSEEGEATDAIPADYTGEDVEIVFNKQYVQYFLNVVSGGGISETETPNAESDAEPEKVLRHNKVAFEFRDSNAQTLLRPMADNGFDYKYIVMPMRI